MRNANIQLKQQIATHAHFAFIVSADLHPVRFLVHRASAFKLKKSDSSSFHLCSSSNVLSSVIYFDAIWFAIYLASAAPTNRPLVWLSFLFHNFPRWCAVSVAVSMLRLRLRCVVDTVMPRGSGGFDVLLLLLPLLLLLLMCKILSEKRRPQSLVIGVGVGVFVVNDNWFDIVVDLSVFIFIAAVAIVRSLSSGSTQERSSDRPLRNDLRNLSTSRMWNLFKLFWLPPVGFGGLHPVLVGLVNELCDVRDDVRENGRELVRFMWARWAGDEA